MKAKDFVKQYYPEAESFCWRYDNRLRRTTYCILDGFDFSKVLFYDTNGSWTESKAWVYAKQQIISGNFDNQGNKPTIKKIQTT